MKNQLTVYPAIFSFDGKQYTVEFIDLDGCYTFGDTIPEAYTMAQDAMGLYLDELINFPNPTLNITDVKIKKNQFITFVSIDMDDYRRKYNSKAIKKTLTIPQWLNHLAERNNINFSQVLQTALKQELNID